jgi:osmoprotectant transport system permease protein
MRRRNLGPWAVFGALSAVFLVMTLDRSALAAFLSALFPREGELLYPRASLVVLVGEHLSLAAISSLLAAAVGIGAGVLATRPGLETFASAAGRLAAVAQTVPPAAVLALAVPAVGFGFAPTVAALFLYSILPIFRNTMSGLAGVDGEVVDAARGLGMGRARILRTVELPLAAPVIVAGLRTAVVVNIGTATVGATIGAGGLGAPIVSGLVNQNPAYLTEGAVAVALLALAVDSLFAAVGKSLATAAPDRAEGSI